MLAARLDHVCWHLGYLHAPRRYRTSTWGEGSTSVYDAWRLLAGVLRAVKCESLLLGSYDWREHKTCGVPHHTRPAAPLRRCLCVLCLATMCNAVVETYMTNVSPIVSGRLVCRASTPGQTPYMVVASTYHRHYCCSIPDKKPGEKKTRGGFADHSAGTTSTTRNTAILMLPHPANWFMKGVLYAAPRRTAKCDVQ